MEERMDSLEGFGELKEEMAKLTESIQTKICEKIQTEARDTVKQKLEVRVIKGLKDRIVRNAHKLKEARDVWQQEVTISLDMTKEERLLDKNLRKRAKARNIAEAGSKNFNVIRGEPWDRYIRQVKRWDATPTGAVTSE
ncbi:hypothetical protein Pcinc_036221 [Petrolisthes cinctipes]|uniref:Uncharacterized protein n=1 Tax=Petrolisthes cinctipes TaxID=88211 RepID=A0AAE1BUX7_PETCI|nr:hypothetical protein Pcinc_036221 [Petrolisthes cinctipes]